jgi:hypothetical protein
LAVKSRTQAIVIVVCAVAALVTAGFASARGAPACAFCNKNLILNPGADQGNGTQTDTVVPIPHWITVPGFTAGSYGWTTGDLNTTTPGPTDRGKNYFYGGPETSTSGNVSTATQKIALPAAAAHHKFQFTGWLGGYSTQGDKARVTLAFMSSSGQALASYAIGPVTKAQRGGTNKLEMRGASNAVPAGAVSAVVVITMTRTDGADNDGLADSLSLVLF